MGSYGVDGQGGAADGQDQDEITLDAILSGQTRSPITVNELKAYLAATPGKAADLAAVDFLLAFQE
jgi:hypothetical protein